MKTAQRTRRDSISQAFFPTFLGEFSPAILLYDVIFPAKRLSSCYLALQVNHVGWPLFFIYWLSISIYVNLYYLIGCLANCVLTATWHYWLNLWPMINHEFFISSHAPLIIVKTVFSNSFILVSQTLSQNTRWQVRGTLLMGHQNVSEHLAHTHILNSIITNPLFTPNNAILLLCF